MTNQQFKDASTEYHRRVQACLEFCDGTATEFLEGSTLSRMITAAPELLAACKLMRSWLLHSGGWSEAIESQVDPVIAKAEGETKCG